MKTTEILIAGFGGQGILFSGKFLAYKGLLEDLQVSWLPSYGPEMRGGTANCNIILSDNPVGSPIITAPNVLIAMNLPSLEKYVDTVVAGGQIYVDSSLIDVKVQRDDVDVFYIPATQMAKDEGISSLANMIIVGHLLENHPELSFDGVEEVVEKLVPPKKAALKELWGEEYAESAANNNLEDVLNGILHGKRSKTADDEYILGLLKEYKAQYGKDNWKQGFLALWGSEYSAKYAEYKVDDVANGIYHGDWIDYTEKAKSYIDKMMDKTTHPDNPELHGCVVVDKDLAEILQILMDKFTFEGVEHSWTKLCYYYLYMGPKA